MATKKKLTKKPGTAPASPAKDKQAVAELAAASPYNDKWIKIISQGGNITATAVTARTLVEEARKRHGLRGDVRMEVLEAKALGETLVAGVLLASNLKKGENISISVKGDKHLKQALVDATPNGTVRGFITSREGPKKIDLTRGHWQEGLLSVVRMRQNEKEPYTGTVPMVTGHLAKDLTFYLSQSEQIPSAVGIAVNLNEDGSIETAGGFLVQVLPGASKDEIKSIENGIHELQSLAARIHEDPDPTRLLARIFSDFAFMVLDEKPLAFECTCNPDRVLRAIALLGRAEIEDMIEKDHGAEIKCDFCSTKYAFSEADLQNILTK